MLMLMVAFRMAVTIRPGEAVGVPEELLHEGSSRSATASIRWLRHPARSLQVGGMDTPPRSCPTDSFHTRRACRSGRRHPELGLGTDGHLQGTGWRPGASI